MEDLTENVTSESDAHLKTDETNPQTVAGDVAFAGEVTATKFITLPASLRVGSNDLNQGGSFFTVESMLDDSKAFLLKRCYDPITGSLDIISEKLSPEQLLDLLPLSGTRFTMSPGDELAGPAGPGVDGYQSTFVFFVYTPFTNMRIVSRIVSNEGPITTTVSSFDSGPIPEFSITNITNAASVEVTAPGHLYVNGDRAGTGNIAAGMVEMNDLVGNVSNVVAGVSFELDIDSTLFATYTTGGNTQGKLITFVGDNLNEVGPTQVYFTSFNMDEPFDLDGLEFPPASGNFFPYAEIGGYNVDLREKLLTDNNVAVEPNTYFVSKGGKDAYSGKSVVQPFATIAAASSAIALESPTQINQFSVTSNSYGVYSESGFPVDLGDWVHLHMPQSSFSGADTSSLSVVNASSFVGSEAYAITSTKVGQSGLLFDGSTSAGFIAKAITSASTGPAINIINSAANSYPDIGYAAGVVTAVNIDTDTTTTTHCNINIVELLADGATGYNVNAPNGPVVLKGDTIRMAGGVTSGESINIDASFLTTIDYQTIEPDMNFNAGKSSLSAQLVKGDITVALGARLDVTSNLTLEGGLFLFGEFNGIVNGVEHGFHVDDLDYLATFSLPGNVPQSFQEFGRIILNQTTDIIDFVSVAYRQNIAQARTVDLRFIDSVTSTVYVTSTDSKSTVGLHVFSAFSIVNPIPLVDTVVEIQIMSSGSQISDASANIYFTRTP